MMFPSPAQLKEELPLTENGRKFIAYARQTAEAILLRKDRRLAAIIGPCSIHDPIAVREYAAKLKKFSSKIDDSFFIVLRLFIEKSRSRLGWKGMLYDPRLDGSNDIVAGLRLSRQLFVEMAELAIPCACEMLEPILAPYFDDVIVWGMIGARISASQPHRQMASGLSFPVGFKNDVHGELDVAISGIVAARSPHSHIGIDASGRICSIKTEGNRLTHLVLRGAEHRTNYDEASIAEALQLLQKQNLEPTIIVDCSHGNSGKDPEKQKIAFESVIEQQNPCVVGVMLESNLIGGRQPMGSDPSRLAYGISITDACLGWEETESLLSMSISSVQK